MNTTRQPEAFAVTTHGEVLRPVYRQGMRALMVMMATGCSSPVVQRTETPPKVVAVDAGVVGADAPLAVAADASPKGEPDMCELFFRAVDRLGACAKLREANHDTFKKIAREVQDTTERPFGRGELAKCQMSLHMLRTDVKLDCPELAAQIPDVEIP